LSGGGQTGKPDKKGGKTGTRNAEKRNTPNEPHELRSFAWTDGPDGRKGGKKPNEVPEGKCEKKGKKSCGTGLKGQRRE